MFWRCLLTPASILDLVLEPGAGAWFLDLLPSSPSSLNGFSTALFVSFPASGCAAGIGVNLYTNEECPMFAAETQYIAF